MLTDSSQTLREGESQGERPAAWYTLCIQAGVQCISHDNINSDMGHGSPHVSKIMAQVDQKSSDQ